MHKSITYNKKGIEFSKGILVNGIASGIKSSPKNDLGLIFTETKASVAGVFTQNSFIAAPIAYSKNVVKRHKKASAILVNSGNANACCGRYGENAVSETVGYLAKALDISSKEILTFSTGSIGKKLPLTPFQKGIPFLVKGLKKNNGEAFCKSILTTDAFKKCRGALVKTEKGDFRIGATCKGAGMIEPSMATMLCFIATDANLPQNLLQEALKQACENSFNRISVDGDMSTNDSVVLLSTGKSGVTIKKTDPEYLLFQEALTEICRFLATEIVKDGEGATKVIRVNVNEAKTENEAKAVARSIANCLLLKCALFGETPNWGRILSSIGSAGVRIDPLKVKVMLQKKVCFNKGEPDFTAAKKLKKSMKKKDIEIEIFLGAGKKDYSMFFSDIGFKYVEINKQ